MESSLTKLDKINVVSKKPLENLLNNLQEAQLLQKNTRNRDNLAFSNVDRFTFDTILTENQRVFKDLREFLEKITKFCASFKKNFEFLLENFANSLENATKPAETRCLDLQLLQKSLVCGKNVKDTRRVFVLMKLLAVSSKISEELEKDLAQKHEIVRRFQENAAKIKESPEFLQELKYYAQIWVHRPALDEENAEDFREKLQIFSSLQEIDKKLPFVGFEIEDSPNISQKIRNFPLVYAKQAPKHPNIFDDSFEKLEKSSKRLDFPPSSRKLCELPEKNQQKTRKSKLSHKIPEFFVENSGILGDVCDFRRENPSLKENLACFLDFFKKFEETPVHLLMFWLFCMVNLAHFLIIPFEIGFSMSFPGNSEGLLSVSAFTFVVKFLWDCSQTPEKTSIFHDSVAISYIFSRIISSNGTFLKIFAIFYLFRWPTLRKSLKFLAQSVISSRFSAFALFFLGILLDLLVVTHFLACFWHFSAKNWLETQKFADFSWETRYIECFFLVFGTFLFQGTAKSSERSMNSREKLLFLLIFCVVLYFSARFFRKLLRGSGLNAEKLVHFREIFAGSSPFLLEKARKSLKMRGFQREKQQTLDFFCENAPQDLKETVLLSTRQKFLKDLKFLQLFSKQTLKSLAVSMKNLHFDKGDAINLADLRRNAEFFVVFMGKLRFSRGFATVTVSTLAKGASFNEISLFCENFPAEPRKSVDFRDFSLKALEPSCVLTLSRARFLEILKENPEDYEKFCYFRDKLLLYKEAETLEKLGLCCEICRGKSHFFREDCEMLNFYFDKALIIKRFASFDQQNQRIAWKRRKVAKISRNSLILSRIMQKNLKKLESLCPKDLRNTVEDDSFADSSHEIASFDDDKIEEKLTFHERNAREALKIDWQKFFEKAKDYTLFFPHNNPAQVVEKLNLFRKKIQKNYMFDENHSNLVSFSPKWTTGKTHAQENEEKSMAKEGDGSSKYKKK